MAILTYNGCTMFRERITASLLSGKAFKITNIRSEYVGNSSSTKIGLQDFEASYLRLIDKLTDGTSIEINETGTTLRFKPGLIVGGELEHDCGTSRSIGWYIEGILPLLPFGKESFHGHFTGITNDTVDISVDTLRGTTLPLLYHFGIQSTSIKIHKRGAPPKGGGVVELFLEIVREITPINLVDCGLIKRVRGTAYCTRVSSTISTRVIDAARGVLNELLPDVRIHSDHYKGTHGGGNSPGYSIYLQAETTTGVMLSVERTCSIAGELPETVGEEASFMLLEQIDKGGAVDSTHQTLMMQLMVMGPEDVCKIRVGNELTPQAIELLVILRDHFGVVFKLKNDSPILQAATEDGSDGMTVGRSHSSGQVNHGLPTTATVTNDAGDEVEVDMTMNLGRDTILVSCLGIGYKNVSRRIR